MTQRTYAVLNAAYPIGGDRALVRELITPRRHIRGQAPRRPDVIGVVEARDHANRALPLREYLAHYDVRQDTRSGSRAGSAIAVRQGSGLKIQSSRLVQISPGNSKVQARYARLTIIREGDRRRAVIVVHLPLKSTGLQLQAARVVRSMVDRQRNLGRTVKVVGDCNMHPRAFARYLGLPHVHGARGDVMFMAYGKGWGDVTGRARRMRGTDHHVLELVVGRDRRSFKTSNEGKAPA